MIVRTRFPRLLVALLLLTVSISISCNEYRVIPKSNKPSLPVALRGVNGYTVAQILL